MNALVLLKVLRLLPLFFDFPTYVSALLSLIILDAAGAVVVMVIVVAMVVAVVVVVSLFYRGDCCCDCQCSLFAAAG